MNASIGTVIADDHQNRRVMSSSSGLLSSIVTIRGSSAIPQIGQAPGASRTISGCIGHVHSVFVTGATSTGSSAIPHFGQAPGPFWRTSGSIGQVYSRSMSAAVAGSTADRRERPQASRETARCNSDCRSSRSAPCSRRVRLLRRARSSSRRLGRGPRRARMRDVRAYGLAFSGLQALNAAIPPSLQ